MNLELFDRQKEDLTRRIEDLIEKLANIVKTQRDSYAFMVKDIELHERANPDRAKELKEENQGIRAASNSLLVKQLEEYDVPLQESCSALGIDPPYRFSSPNSPDSGEVPDGIKEKRAKVKIELKNLDFDKYAEVEATTNGFSSLIRPPLEKYLVALKTMPPRPDYVRDADESNNSPVASVAIMTKANAKEPTVTGQSAEDEENRRIAMEAIKERTGPPSEKVASVDVRSPALPSIESQIMPPNMGSPSLSHQSHKVSLEKNDWGWDYWKALEIWTILEAEYLVLGCTRPDTQAYVNSIKWARSIGHECEPSPPGLDKLHKMVCVALKHGSLRCSVDPKDMRHINSTDVFCFEVNPGEFIRWCATKERDIPGPLKPLLDSLTSVEEGDIEEDDLLEDEANSEEQGDAHIENYVFRKDGASWEIVFNGNRLKPMRHMLGFQYIAALLERPGKQLSALELVRNYRGTAATDASNVDMRDSSLTVSPTMDNLAMDPSELQTLRNYRKELGELDRDIAEEEHNQVSKNELIERQDWLLAEIGRLTDKTGKPRVVDPEVEKARKAVREAIMRAYEALEDAKEQPELLRYLDKSITLGSHIMYCPSDGISWIT